MSFTRSKSAHGKHRSATSRSRPGGSRKSSANGRSDRSDRIPDSRITRSSANVFADIGFPPEEARSLQVRTLLMLEIEDLVEKRKLTQARAAKLFGVTQPRMSDLMRGRIEKFSVDMLITMLGRAGLEVDIRVSSPRAA